MLPDLENQVVVITDGAVAADRSVAANVHAPIELLLVGRASAANLAVVQLTARASGDTNESELAWPELQRSAGQRRFRSSPTESWWIQRILQID
ncbi:MAG: hypothetical protein R2848_18170 [Thermomicrobiales bacterium]